MADGVVAITAGSGTPIRVLTGMGANNADQQVMTLADAAGNLLGTSAAPFLTSNVSDPDATASGALTANDAVVAAPAGDGALLSGTPTAGSSVTLAAPGGDSSWDVQLSGTFGGGTVYFEASFDGGTNWLPVNGRQTGVINTVLGFSATGAGAWRGNTSGATNLRARLRGATAPSITVTLRIAAGVGAVFLNASIPAGANWIGTAALPPATLVVSASAAAAAGTATLPAAGAGLFHYITNITIQRTTSAATTGANSGFVTGGTNHGLIFQLPSDTQAIGFSQTVINYSPQSPLRVTAANTATTITTPTVTATTYRITVTYFTAA